MMLITDDMGCFTANYVPSGKCTATFIDPAAGPNAPKIETEIEIPEDETEFTYDFVF
jgi:hypothetical protein